MTLEGERQATRRRLRADAVRNSEQIIGAARALFAERGMDVPMDEIARQAGVGNATLYRRFPTRDFLVAAVFEERLEEHREALEDAMRAPTAWAGFSTFLEHLFARQAEDRGVNDVLTRVFPLARALEDLRMRMYARFGDLVERAQADGSLRADFVIEDLDLMLMANAGVVQTMGDSAEMASKRLVAMFLAACRSTVFAVPLPDAPWPAHIYRAMLRRGQTRRRRPASTTS